MKNRTTENLKKQKKALEMIRALNTEEEERQLKEVKEELRRRNTN